MNNLLDLIPFEKIQAQGLDAVAQPTFGTLEVTGGGGARASVLLKADKTSVIEGEKFKVRVELKTGETGASINQYKIVIDFSPSKLTAIDQDGDTQGTQIKLLDTIFQVEDPKTQNIVSQEGRITLIAKTVSGNAFQVNREVAEIEFQAVSIGAATIRVAEGTSGTQLVRQSGVGLSYTTNQLTIQLNQETDEGDTGDGGTDGQNGQGTNGQTTTPPVTNIPDTALADNIGLLIGSVGGALFILLGLMLIVNKEADSKTSKKH